MRRFVACVIVAIAGLVIGGCASQQAMTSGARGALQTDVSAVQRDVEARHPRSAHAALVRLRSEVAKLEANGDLSATSGTTVLGAAAEVQANLVLITTTTTTTTTTLAPPPTPKKGKPHGPKHGNKGGGD